MEAARPRRVDCFIVNKQLLHRDEATNPSRQPVGPVCPISLIGPICLPLVLLVLSILLDLLVLSVLLVLLDSYVPLVLLVLLDSYVPLVLLDSYVPLDLLGLYVPLVLLVPLIPSPLSGSPPPRGRSGGGWGRLGRAASCVGWGSYGWAVRAAGFGCLHKQKSPSRFLSKGFSLKKGGYLLSHGCAVPSARAGLTSLFGMGRGGTPPL